MRAAENNRLESVQLLLDKGAAINSKNVVSYCRTEIWVPHSYTQNASIQNIVCMRLMFMKAEWTSYTYTLWSIMLCGFLRIRLYGNHTLFHTHIYDGQRLLVL